MAQRQEVRVETLNVNTGRPGPRISRELYEAVKQAILAAVPAKPPGLPWKELTGQVIRRAPKHLFKKAFPGGYTVVVKPDLEPRGMIERLPGAGPQRLPRTSGGR